MSKSPIEFKSKTKYAHNFGAKCCFQSQSTVMTQLYISIFNLDWIILSNKDTEEFLRNRNRQLNKNSHSLIRIRKINYLIYGELDFKNQLKLSKHQLFVSKTVFFLLPKQLYYINLWLKLECHLSWKNLPYNYQ